MTIKQLQNTDSRQLAEICNKIWDGEYWFNSNDDRIYQEDADGINSTDIDDLIPIMHDRIKEVGFKNE